MRTRVNPYAIGIDLGGTKIEGAVIDESGKIYASKRIKTIKESVPEQITALIEDLLKESGLAPAAIGIGAAGQIDKKNEEILFSPNIFLKNCPLKKVIEEKTSIFTTLLNDVRASATAEWKLGPKKGDTLFIFLGTGIGGACIFNGELVKGSSNTFGEIGHSTIDFKGDLCNCGKKGCLEVYASGWGIAKRGNKPRASDVFKENQTILNDAFDALTLGIASFVNLYNPDHIILGGGMLKVYKEAIPDFLKTLESRIKKNSLAAANHFTLSEAALSNFSGAIGAGLEALDEWKKQEQEK